jgi:hypothetical protein
MEFIAIQLLMAKENAVHTGPSQNHMNIKTMVIAHIYNKVIGTINVAVYYGILLKNAILTIF